MSLGHANFQCGHFVNFLRIRSTQKRRFYKIFIRRAQRIHTHFLQRFNNPNTYIMVRPTFRVVYNVFYAIFFVFFLIRIVFFSHSALCPRKTL